MKITGYRFPLLSRQHAWEKLLIQSMSIRPRNDVDSVTVSHWDACSLQDSLWRYSDVVLVAVLWDAFLLDRKMLGGKELELALELSLGSAGDRLLWQHQDPGAAPVSEPHSREQGFNFLQLHVPLCPVLSASG